MFPCINSTGHHPTPLHAGEELVVPTHGERTMLEPRLSVAKAGTLCSMFQPAVSVTLRLGRSTQTRADTWKRKAGKGGLKDNNRRYFQVRLALTCALVVLFQPIAVHVFGHACLHFLVCPEHILAPGGSASYYLAETQITIYMRWDLGKTLAFCK